MSVSSQRGQETVVHLRHRVGFVLRLENPPGEGLDREAPGPHVGGQPDQVDRPRARRGLAGKGRVLRDGRQAQALQRRDGLVFVEAIGEVLPDLAEGARFLLRAASKGGPDS